jgi:hypothetical protein
MSDRGRDAKIEVTRTSTVGVALIELPADATVHAIRRTASVFGPAEAAALGDDRSVVIRHRRTAIRSCDDVAFRFGSVSGPQCWL